MHEVLAVVVVADAGKKATWNIWNITVHEISFKKKEEKSHIVYKTHTKTLGQPSAWKKKNIKTKEKKMRFVFSSVVHIQGEKSEVYYTLFGANLKP